SRIQSSKPRPQRSIISPSQARMGHRQNRENRLVHAQDDRARSAGSASTTVSDNHEDKAPNPGKGRQSRRRSTNSPDDDFFAILRTAAGAELQLSTRRRSPRKTC